jgi:hypothetical protein
MTSLLRCEPANETFRDLNEGSSVRLTGQFTDEDGVALASNTMLDTVTITLFVLDDDAYPIVNSRDAQDVLGGAKTGQNNVVISATAALTWYLQAADLTLAGQTRVQETHRALIRWTWTTGGVQRANNVELDFVIRNLIKVV